MEFFEGHAEMENLLEEEPARVVNELRNRVQDDLASNGHAWIMVGRGLTKLGFEEQGLESISYGESLLSSSEVTENEESADLPEDIGDADSVRDQESSASEGYGGNEQFEDRELLTEGPSIISISDNLILEEESSILASKPDYSQDSEAIILMSTGDYNGAIEAWTRLIKIEESAGRWNGLAESLEALGYSNRANKARLRASSTAEAIEAASRVDLEALARSVEAKQPNEPTRLDTVNEGIEWYNKGLILLNDGKPLEALGCFEKTLYTRSDGPEDLRIRAKVGIADAYSALNRYEEAISAYVQTYEAKPESLGYAAIFNMGNAYTHLGRFDDAITCLKKSSEMNQDRTHKKTVKALIKQVKALKKASSR
jgi:tetratricopeptide (TPR) repeat protein